MSRIIPALIFILMAVADGQDIRKQEQQQFGDNIRKDDLESNHLVSKSKPHESTVLECPDIGNKNKDTVYIFKPQYNDYDGLPGLFKEIAANSSVKCIKNNKRNSAKDVQCCLPFDYNDKTIEEIRCSGCETTMDIIPGFCTVPKWEPETCKCKVIKGNIINSKSHKVMQKRDENGEDVDDIKLVCPAGFTNPSACWVQFSLMKLKYSGKVTKQPKQQITN